MCDQRGVAEEIGMCHFLTNDPSPECCVCRAVHIESSSVSSMYHTGDVCAKSLSQRQAFWSPVI